MNNWKIRAAGVFLLAATVWYIPWLLSSLNWKEPWLSVPFTVANLMVMVVTLVSLINNWQRIVAEEQLVPTGEEPTVAVIISTCGEPARMVYLTGKSVLTQNWPEKNLVVVISDDVHRNEIRQIAKFLQREHPLAKVIYNKPPRCGDSSRNGDAKAGNLNSALELVDKIAPQIEFVETRDADDKVGSPDFLRQVIGQLQADPNIAFVQTIKECEAGDGDPFANKAPLFYRGVMLSKNAANAVFPCGSGVVWRREALSDIGGFPTWNLLEDLHSGVEVLRRGWRGIYLPIVGAVAQIVPEDIPNVYKQRGTWALDTMRLFWWKNPLFTKGLSIRQRLHFLELGLFYLLSFATLVLATVPVISLFFNIYPLVTNHVAYALHFWLYAMAIELFLVTLADGLPYESLWRSRQMWLGLAPVYAKACILALWYGPNRKPAYQVTRKNHQIGWYWRETFIQSALLVALVVAVLYQMATRSLLMEADLGSIFWAGFFISGLAGIVRRSWFGFDWQKEVQVAMRRLWDWGLTPKYALATIVLAIAVAFGIGFLGSGQWWPTLATSHPPAKEPLPTVVAAVRLVQETTPTRTTVAPTATMTHRLELAIPTMTATAVVVAAAATPEQFPSLKLNPAGKVGLGAYLNNTPYDDFEATNRFERLVNHKMYYALWFQSWGDSDKEFSVQWVREAAAQGFVPVITWEPWKRNFASPTTEQPNYSFASITAGNHDEYIRSWARGAKTVGVPIILRFAHEQSTQPGTKSWYPWQGDPEGFKAAYRYILNIFRKEGTTNVKFLWSAMWLDSDWVSAYYPGDDAVNLVGTTVLNHGTVPTLWWVKWHSFDELFAGQYQTALQWGKPIILAELATAEQGGNKAVWLQSCFSDLQTKYPLVEGVLLFEVTSDREWPDINWSVVSSEESLTAFQQVIDSPYFK